MSHFFLNINYSSAAQSLTDFANNSTNNGILTFILGTLFVLSIYHFLLFFQHKDRAYLYYSLYTGLIFLAYITKVESGFLKDLSDLFGLTDTFGNLYRWSYNCLYFVFAVKFLDIKVINKRWFQYIIYPIAVLFGLGVLAQISKSLFGFNSLYDLYDSLYLPIITLQTVFSFWFIFQLKGNLKYYIIIGAIILFLTSIAGERSIRELPFINISSETGDFIFYLGVFIENICFSLGLGHKQKHIIEERNTVSTSLISKLQENENLKEEINLQLQEKVDALNDQIEFKQEIADLRLQALQNQMNPHFIFNSLNSIKLYIINNEKENAVYYLNKFAKLIRKILEASRKKEITLEEELETSELYMNIENIRFNNEIEYKTHIEDTINTSQVKVPSLILQPFLENSLWHGLSSKKGKKTIVLHVNHISNDHIRLSLTDNGIGRSAAAKFNANKFAKGKSVGIEITKQRLSNFSRAYEKDFVVTINDLKDTNGKAKGTNVTIDIPRK